MPIDAINLFTTARAGTLIPIAAPIGAPYDLYGTDAQSRGPIPFAVTWPAAPTTSGVPLEVPSVVDIATALATPNAIINVAAGSYGSFNPSASDQVWNLNNGATFTSLFMGQDRIQINGGVFNLGGGDINLSGGDDVLYNNVNLFSTGGTFVLYGSQRLAFVQTTIETTNGYAVYNFGRPKGGAADIIMAGSHFIADGGAINAHRIMGAVRQIAVDCIFDSPSSRPGMRSHEGTEDLWFRRCMFDECGGLFCTPEINDTDYQTPNDYMGDHWFYDMELYSFDNNSGPCLVVTNAEPPAMSVAWPGDLTIVGYRSYQTGASGLIVETPIGGTYTQSDNQFNAYQARPGTWNTANGIAPGADH